MKIRGITVGTTMPRANLEQTDPKKADYVMGREKIASVYIGPEQPTDGTLYWLDTSEDEAEVTVYTVTSALTAVTIDNTAETVNEGESYTATITANDGYTLSDVTITMGGEDITSTAYSNGTITIAEVTGDIVITAAAVEDVEVTLSSISAVYSGGDVAAGTELTDLTGIVVTATYSDGSTKTVTDYTLSGTIANGDNTITVSYEGMTATFTVTGHSGYTITYNLTNVTLSNMATFVSKDDGYYYTELTVADGYTLDALTVTVGGEDVTASVYNNTESTITIDVTADVVITISAIDTSIIAVSLVASDVKFAWNNTDPYSQYIITASEGVNVYEYAVEAGKTYAFYVTNLGQYTNPYVTSNQFSKTDAGELFAVTETPITDFSVGTHTVTWDTNATVGDVIRISEDDGTYTKYRTFTPAVSGYMYYDDRIGIPIYIKEVTE